jgi:hypothetical protein
MFEPLLLVLLVLLLLLVLAQAITPLYLTGSGATWPLVQV